MKPGARQKNSQKAGKKNRGSTGGLKIRTNPNTPARRLPLTTIGRYLRWLPPCSMRYSINAKSWATVLSQTKSSLRQPSEYPV